MPHTLGPLVTRMEKLARGGLKTAVQLRAKETLAPRARELVQKSIRQRLRSRSGSLLKAVVARTEAHGEGTRVLVEIDHPGADILNDGGTITPRKGRALAIPVGPALKADGSARYRSARAAPVDLVIVKRRGKSAVLLDPRTARVWFVLVPRVRIRGRHYLEPALVQLLAEAVPLIEREVARAIEGRP